MKKILLTTSLFVLVASSAFAGALATHVPTTGGAVAVYGGVIGAAATAPTPLVKSSTGVNLLVDFSGTTDYLIVAKHTTGSKVFGTNYELSNIYWKQSVSGTLATSMLTGISSGSAASSSFVGNGWTSY